MKRLAAPLAVLLGLTGGCDERRPGEAMSREEVAAELAQLEIEPGLWELSREIVEVSAPDLPREVRNKMVGPRSRIRNCISPAQAEQPGANFLAMRADSACSYRDFSVREGRMQGVMTCPDASATMDGRYGASAYDLRLRMESPMPGGARMTLLVRAQGRRIGACEEETRG